MTENARLFQLEQCYVAMPTSGAGRQLIASSSSVAAGLVEEFARLAPLQAPILKTPEFNEPMPLTVGIFRGETVDYIIARAGRTPDGKQMIIHYLAVPAAAVRWLGGNLTLLEGIVQAPLVPPDRSLPAFVFEPVSPTYELQNRVLLALLRTTKNNTKLVNGLTASLIQAVGVGVINAPPDLTERLSLLMGLLMLLPLPARVALTFVTSVGGSSNSRAQFKFFDTAIFPTNHVVFDWANKKLIGDAPEHPYSKYIVAQLRLDTSLVVEQTERLSRTAVWRALRKDDLANALTWLAKRAGLDSVIQANQPADRAMVASVLREDPTLPDDLRVAYAKHLINFSILLDDPTYTEIIPTAAAQNQEVASAIYDQLESAAAKPENAKAAFRMVAGWISQPPLGVEVERWRPLLSLALATRHTAVLQKRDTAEMLTLMSELSVSSSALHIENSIIGILNTGYQLAYQDGRMAHTIFLMALTHLSLDDLQRILGDARFSAQLPLELRELIPYFTATPNQSRVPRAGLLVRAADVYGTAEQPLILGRLVEWAISLRRWDLLDTLAIRSLIEVTRSPYAQRFEALILSLIQAFAEPDLMRTLPPETTRQLMAMSLALGRYDETIDQLLHYQDVVFRPAETGRLADLVQRVLREAPLSANQLQAFLEVLAHSNLRTTAKLAGFVGALEGQHYHVEMEPAAKQLAAMWTNDPRLIALRGIDPVLNLMASFVARKDRHETMKLAVAVVDYVIAMGADGDYEDSLSAPQVAETLYKVYGLLSRSPDLQTEAIPLLASYVRNAEPATAETFIAAMSSKDDRRLRQGLEATRTLRNTLGGHDFHAFNDHIVVASTLLADFSALFAEGQEIPPLFKLRRWVGAMTSSQLFEADRRQLSDQLTRLARQLMQLFLAQQLRTKNRTRAELEQARLQLLNVATTPSTGVEALLWFSGYLIQGRVPDSPAPHEQPSSLLGARALADMLTEIQMTVQVLDCLLTAFPADRPAPELEPTAWTKEVDTVWAFLSTGEQAYIQTPSGVGAYQLARLIQTIGTKANDKHLLDNGPGKQLFIGKQQPRSVVDLLRWIAGFYAGAHE